MVEKQNSEGIVKKVYPGTKNLRPVRTTEEAREKGRKGGLAKKGYRAIGPLIKQVLQIELPDNVIKNIPEWLQIQGVKDISYGIVIKQVDRAMKGDIKSAEFLADRSEGKPTQKIDASLEGDRPNEIVVRFEAPKKEDNGQDK